MRVVIDGLPIRGMSLAIVVQHLLEGWGQLGRGDELHLVTGPEAEVEVGDHVTVHRLEFGKWHAISRLRAQSLTVPHMCRELDADVLLGVLPTTVITPLRCPRAVIAYDLRHEQRPDQFSKRALVLRTVSYDLGFRQADAIACISERTREDLVASRPWLSPRPVRVTLLGADHVDTWPVPTPGPGYALAFGQYANKNVDLVIDAWAVVRDRTDAMPLVIVGLDERAGKAALSKVAGLGLAEDISVLPWLSEQEFRARFSSASLVVFPSDFEGFGLPALEAMRLGIPVVISPERALLEITEGHASVMRGWNAPALADAVTAAVAMSGDDLAAARRHTDAFTWARTAQRTRDMLAEIVRTHEPRAEDRNT